jgi:hypothetical protein
MLCGLRSLRKRGIRSVFRLLLMILDFGPFLLRVLRANRWRTRD